MKLPSHNITGFKPKDEKAVETPKHNIYIYF